MRRIVILLMLLAGGLAAMERTAGYCEKGNVTAATTAPIFQVGPQLQGSYPSCTVTVYLAGTTTPATIYADDASTPLANPFTAATDGYWFFYADDGRYDVRFSGVMTPAFTHGDAQPLDYRSTFPGSGAIPRVFKQKLNDFVSVKDFGAIGDGTTDDTDALRAALAYACPSATGGAGLYFPAGSYKWTGDELDCTITSLNHGLHIFGDGPKSILLISGTNNGGFHLTGSDAVGQDQFYVANMKIASVTSGTASFGLKLDGVAGYGVMNVMFDGNFASPTHPAAKKMEIGLWLFNSQQGYVKGGVYQDMRFGIKIGGTTNIPNAADISGVTLAPSSGGSGACFYIDAAADAFIHANHCTTADYGFYLHSGGSGAIVIDSNHIELNALAAIAIDPAYNGSSVYIEKNSFFNAGTELLLDGTTSVHVNHNQINGNVTFTTCFVCTFIDNHVFSGILTDTTGTLQQYSNSFSTNPTTIMVRWSDPAHYTFPSTSIITPGDVVTFTGNPLVSGNWGINIPGVGANQYAYIKLHDTQLRGATNGDNFSAYGTSGNYFIATQGAFSVPGQFLSTGGLASLGKVSSGINRLGFNYNAQSGGLYNATVNGWQLDANDVADAFAIKRYDHAGSFLWNDFYADASGNVNFPKKVASTGVVFGSLGAAVAGTWVWCTNCAVATPCAGAGSGAWAFYSSAASTWNCPF